MTNYVFFQFYLVMKGAGKQEEANTSSKTGPGKFVHSKVRNPHNSVSQASAPIGGQPLPPSAGTTHNNTQGGSSGGMPSTIDANKQLSEKDIQQELDRIFDILKNLKENKDNNVDCTPNGGVAKKIAAIQEAIVGGNNKNNGNATNNVGGGCNPAAKGAPPKRASVTLLNGQIMNCDAAPLNNLCVTPSSTSVPIVTSVTINSSIQNSTSTNFQDVK